MEVGDLVPSCRPSCSAPVPFESTLDPASRDYRMAIISAKTDTINDNVAIPWADLTRALRRGY
jgi:hypothetical protein